MSTSDSESPSEKASTGSSSEYVTLTRYIGRKGNTAFEDINSREFLAALQGGSQGAFDALVDRLLPRLTKFLTLGGTVPEADAEELAIDVLMTVHAKIGTFRHGGRAKLTTWIFEIAKNRAIDFERAHVPTMVELTSEWPQTLHENHSSPSGQTTQLVKWLQQQLDQFSEQDQYLLKWRALDIPYSQIAEWLGIKEGAARVRHKRAIEKLRAAAPELAAQKGSGRS